MVGVMVVLGGASDAWAVRTEVLTIKPLEIDICIHPNKIVHLHFPMDVNLLSAGSLKDIDAPTTNIITIQRLDGTGTNMVIAAGQYRVVVNAVPGPEHEVETLIDFVEQEPLPTESRPSSDRERERSYWYALLHKLNEEGLGDSRQPEWHSGQHRIGSTIGNVTRGERFLSFVATLHNAGDLDFPLSGVELRELERDENHLILAVPDTADLRLPKVLKRRETLRIAVLAKDAALLSSGWRLGLISTIGIPPALFKWTDGGYRVPIGQERLTVGVEATGGVARHAHGSDNQFGISRGVRARVRYGVTPRFAIEGLLGLIDTTEVAFQDGSAAKMTGGLAMVNGVLTLGDRIVPFVRVGGGVAPATIRNFDGRRFDLFPAFSLGVGLDAWIRQKFLVGLAVEGIGSTNEVMPFTLAASVHFSYAWNLGNI